MNKNNAKKSPVYVTMKDSSDMAALHQKGKVSVAELRTMFPAYSQRSIYRHAKRNYGEGTEDKRKNNPGRPSKLSEHDRRAILRSVKSLRRNEGPNFTSGRVKVEAGLSGKVSNRTIIRVLSKNGYRYRQARRKGLLKLSDFTKRLKFCRKVQRRKLGVDYWTRRIAFYLDGKGFVYKTNPHDQARAPSTVQWRKRAEGLEFTAKGRKEGQVNINFMVAIAHNKGVVLCERYEGAITGKKMAEIVDLHFERAFEVSADPRGRRFLMDNCPRQNCREAHRAYARLKAQVFLIPPRSPDLNPIENFFHQVTRKLKQQALDKNITHETKDELEERIKKTMKDFPLENINRLIESMPKRVNMVIKAGGKRIRY